MNSFVVQLLLAFLLSSHVLQHMVKYLGENAPQVLNILREASFRMGGSMYITSIGRRASRPNMRENGE